VKVLHAVLREPEVETGTLDVVAPSHEGLRGPDAVLGKPVDAAIPRERQKKKFQLSSAENQSSPKSRWYELVISSAVRRVRVRRCSNPA